MKGSIETGDVGKWHLTFDVSGRPQTAKLAVGCPLDGGVRFHCTLYL